MLAGWIEACDEDRVDPSGIGCPTLLLMGEDEYAYPASRRFPHEALEKIRHPEKRLVVGRTDLGAGGKNMLPNLAAMRNTTYDWLDEVFATAGEATAPAGRCASPGPRHRPGGLRPAAAPAW
jgi:hypothetical protein